MSLVEALLEKAKCDLKEEKCNTNYFLSSSAESSQYSSVLCNTVRQSLTSRLYEDYQTLVQSWAFAIQKNNLADRKFKLKISNHSSLFSWEQSFWLDP